MRYYDTTQKNIKIIVISGIGTYRQEIAHNLEITKETPSFIYGYDWDGRYKYDKKQKTWYKYEYYIWRKVNIKSE